MVVINLTRDVVAPFEKKAYPTDLPDFNENRVSSVTVFSPWWGTIPLTIASYSAADWADGAKPAAGEIMFSETDRQWKANQWIVGPFGDVLELITRPYNERAPEP